MRHGGIRRGNLLRAILARRRVVPMECRMLLKAFFGHGLTLDTSGPAAAASFCSAPGL
jgi:hypothetical protein